MQKKKCIIKSKVTGYTCEGYFDVNKNLINHIRVWCMKNKKEMKQFIPDAYLKQISLDTIPKNMNVSAELKYGDQVIVLEPTKVFSDYIKIEEGITILPEIHLNIDDYDPNRKKTLIKKDTFRNSYAKQERKVPDTANGSYEVDTNSSELKKHVKKDDDKGTQEKYTESIIQKKKQYFVPFLVGIGVVGVICGFIFSTVLNPINQIRDAIADGEYDSVVYIYNHKIDGNEKKERKIHPELSDCIDEIQRLYKQGNASYESVIEDLRMLVMLKDEELSNRAQDSIDFIEVLQNEIMSFEEAEALYDQGNYLEAMCSYAKITETSDVYETAQEKYNTCMHALLKEVAKPSSAEEYTKYIGILEDYLKVIQEEEFVSRKEILELEYEEFQNTTVRTSAMELAKLKVAENNYKEAFDTIHNALETLPEDGELLKLLNEYQEQYVGSITAQVENYTAANNLEEAKSLLNMAVSIYDCEEFKTMLSNLGSVVVTNQGTSSYGTLDVEPIEFIRHTASIDKKDEMDSYTFKAAETGNCAVACTDMVNGFTVNVKVYEVGLQDCVASSYGLRNQYLSFEVKKDKEYKITVEQREKTGTYNVKIGQQKGIVDINAFDKINDSIDFYKQNNTYTFTASVTGYYRFGITNVMSGTEFNLFVYDDLNDTIGYSYGLVNNRGITIELVEGKTYRVEISYRKGYGEYTLNIGRQSKTTNIVLDQHIHNFIKFTDEIVKYTFTSASEGTYKMSFSNMKSGLNFYINVYDDLNYRIERYKMSDNKSFVFDLKANKTYRIEIEQNEKSGDYSFVLTR